MKFPVFEGSRQSEFQNVQQRYESNQQFPCLMRRSRRSFCPQQRIANVFVDDIQFNLKTKLFFDNFSAVGVNVPQIASEFEIFCCQSCAFRYLQFSVAIRIQIVKKHRNKQIEKSACQHQQAINQEFINRHDDAERDGNGEQSTEGNLRRPTSIRADHR